MRIKKIEPGSFYKYDLIVIGDKYGEGRGKTLDEVIQSYVVDVIVRAQGDLSKTPFKKGEVVEKVEPVGSIWYGKTGDIIVIDYKVYMCVDSEVESMYQRRTRWMRIRTGGRLTDIYKLYRDGQKKR